MSTRKRKLTQVPYGGRAGLTQVDFWCKLGVKQSGGSQYERSHSIPKPLAHLVGLVNYAVLISRC